MAAPEINGYGHLRNASEAATLVSSPHNPAASEPVIPPKHTGRTLVLCFDGTGDQFDYDNSNIVKLFAMLKKDDSNHQMCYYQAGIGTYINPEIATPLMAKISKMFDEAIAWNLHAHVMDGYEFLMQNYKAGDRISIFGFSRGAYTARALAGMIHKVGLLPACNRQQIPFAYKMFTSDDHDEDWWDQCKIFKKTFSVNVKIDFLGVWDTVNSVGLIPRRLSFTKWNTIVRTFRHAIALDERRAKFKPNFWDQPNENPHSKKKIKRKAIERAHSEVLDEDTNIKEVWFAGCHCDVGGGSVANGTPHTLARIPLRWMIRECFATNTGIMFHTEGLRHIGIDPASLRDLHIDLANPHHPNVPPRPPRLPPGDAPIQRIPKKVQRIPKTVQLSPKAVDMTEEEHERLDALSPIYDQLKLARFWWLLECFPMKQRHQKNNGDWEKEYCLNRGRGRRIPKQKKGTVFIHRSVLTRIDARCESGKKYASKASFEKALDHNNVVWVD